MLAVGWVVEVQPEKTDVVMMLYPTIKMFLKKVFGALPIRPFSSWYQTETSCFDCLLFLFFE